MTPEEKWQSTLARVSARCAVLPLDAAPTEAEWASLADVEPPALVRAFAELWSRREPDPWRVLVACAVAANPGIGDEVDEVDVSDGTALASLRSLLTRVDRAALVFERPSRTSPEQWGYVLQVRHAQRLDAHKNVILRPPTQVGDLMKVEHVLALGLPPSYMRFLSLTNGLELGERELSYVCGAGPLRANWSDVQLNRWMECGGQHEIAAQWREFQGTYAYERIIDRERGENIFLSDETALIPFGRTYEAWCFDRMRQDSAGELPIVLWDHETREAIDRYANFDDWFAGEVESHLFGNE